MPPSTAPHIIADQSNLLKDVYRSLDMLCDQFVLSSFGPSGRFKFMRYPNSGGFNIGNSVYHVLQNLSTQRHAESSSDAARFLPHPVLEKIILQSMRNHVESCGDGSGAFLILVRGMLRGLLLENNSDATKSAHGRTKILSALQMMADVVLPEYVFPALQKSRVQCGEQQLRNVIFTQLVTNMSLPIAEHLTDIIMQYVNGNGNGDEDGEDETSDLQTRLAFLSRYFEQLVVCIGGTGSVRQSSCINGLFLERNRSSRFMPTEVSGSFKVLLLQDPLDASAEEDDDEAASPPPVLNLGTNTEDIKKIQAGVSDAVNAFVEKLLDSNVRVVLVCGSRMDEQLAHLLGRKGIAAFDFVDTKEKDLIMDMFHINTPCFIPGISKNHLLTLSKSRISSVDFGGSCFGAICVRSLSFAPGTSREFVSIIPESCAPFSLVIRAPTNDMAIEYSRLVKRVITSLCFSSSKNAELECFVPGGGHTYLVAYNALGRARQDHKISSSNSYIQYAIDAVREGLADVVKQLLINSSHQQCASPAILREFELLVSRTKNEEKKAGLVSLLHISKQMKKQPFEPTCADDTIGGKALGTLSSTCTIVDDPSTLGVTELLMPFYDLLTTAVTTIHQLLRIQSCHNSKKVQIQKYS